MSFGRLERTPGAQPMSEINMTPLIDVMLVLLVIFIITAPLMVSAVKVDLPTAASAKAAETPKFVALAIDKSGQVFVDDRPQTMEELAQRLQMQPSKTPAPRCNCAPTQRCPMGVWWK